MLGRRIALAVVLAVAGASAAACGKGGAARHEVVPGAPAGIVREVAGTVTATRPGAAPRALTVGAAVSGDDVIETGADGSVLIELDHNHVTFTLPAGKQQQVAASLAWSQPVAAAQAASTSDEHSAAAGRAIERSAVDTEASGGGEAAPAAAIAPPEQPVAPPTPTTKGTPTAKDTPPAPRRPPADDGVAAANHDEAGQAAALADSNETMAAPPPPPPPPPPDTGDKAPESDPTPTVAARSPGPPHVPSDTSVDITVTGPLTHADIDPVLDPAKLRGCMRSAVGSATIVIGTSGKASRVTTDAGAPSTTCMRNAIKKLTFPKKKAQTTITIKWIEFPE